MPFGTMEKEKVSFQKRVGDMRKRIQLAEGMRKAYYEECESEKKKNFETVVLLKKECRDLYTSFGKSAKCDESVVKKIQEHYPHEGYAIRNKSWVEAIEFIDDKIGDLKKKLNAIRHDRTEFHDKVEKLTAEFENVMQKGDMAGADDEESNRVRILENKIHQVNMNIMETTHIQKKYRTIKDRLVKDSITFTRELEDIEKEIYRRHQEIAHLQGVNIVAGSLRDATKSELHSQETNTLASGKEREEKLFQYRQEVEVRRNELELLERRIFPPTRPALRRDSQSSSDQQVDETDQAAFAATELELSIQKLKLTTGETDIQFLLKRFQEQDDTYNRLEVLKEDAEDEVRKLQSRKDRLKNIQEEMKYSEVNEKEKNKEEVANFQNLITKQEERASTLKHETEHVLSYINKITSGLEHTCKKLKDMSLDPVPPYSSEVEDGIVLLAILNRKIEATMEKLKHQDIDELIDRAKTENFESLLLPSSPFNDEVAKLISIDAMMSGELGKKPILSESESDDEIPTRNLLKRQAQVVIDSKSRRKAKSQKGHKK